MEFFRKQLNNNLFSSVFKQTQTKNIAIIKAFFRGLEWADSLLCFKILEILSRSSVTCSLESFYLFV